MLTPARPPRRKGAPSRLRGQERTALAWGLGVSLALHVLLVLVYPFFVAPDPSGVQLPAVAQPTGEPEGTRLLEIVELPPTVQTEPEPPVEEPAPEPVAPVAAPAPEAPAGGPVDTEVEEPRLTAAERLRPHIRDSVLWREVDRALTALTDQQLAQLLLEWELTEINELMLAESMAAANAMDWTVTDADGNKWGVSPGTLHLGKLTLPLPINFSPPRGTNPTFDRRLLDYDDINRAAGRRARWESWQQRAKEIRARKDAERARSRPDTTRSRPG